MVLRKNISLILAALSPMLIPCSSNADIPVSDGFSLGFVQEIEIPLEVNDSTSTQDITISKCELSLNAEPIEGISGHTVLLWEGEGDVGIDEAVIALSSTEIVPVYLETGLKAIPFGVFNTNMLADPLVKELAEAKENVVQVGYSNHLFDASCGVFNGVLDEPETTGKLDNYFLSVGFHHPVFGVASYVSWTSDLGEGGLKDYFLALPDTIPYVNSAGLDIALTAQFSFLTLAIEYVTALDEWQCLEENTKPSAWYSEIACAFRERYTVAVRYEGCSGFLERAEARYGIAGSYRIEECASIGIEYLGADFENASSTPSIITARLSLEI